MIVGFITTYAISPFHHKCCEVEFRSWEVYLLQHYVIKFVSDMRQFRVVFTRYSVSSTNKTDRHDITGILLKVTLNTITLTLYVVSDLLLKLTIQISNCSSSIIDKRSDVLFFFNINL